MKRLLALFCTLTVIFASIGGLTVNADNNYDITLDVSDVSIVNMGGTDYVKAVVNISSILPYSEYTIFNTNSKGSTGIKYELSYDTESLTFFAAMNSASNNFGASLGKTEPSYSISKNSQTVMNITDVDLAEFYFTINSGVDFDKQKVEFSFVEGATLISYFSDNNTIDYGDYVGGAVTDPVEIGYVTGSYGTAAATTYDVKVGETVVGSYEKGAAVTVTATPAAGQKVKDYTVTGIDKSAITVEGNDYKFIMPEGAVEFSFIYGAEIPAVFSIAGAKSSIKYYTDGPKVVEVFNCTATGATTATTWYLTFDKAGTQRTFPATMPAVSGDPAFVFDAWVVSQDGGVEFVSGSDVQ